MNGKGDKQRQGNLDAYRSNYERIFGQSIAELEHAMYEAGFRRVPHLESIGQGEALFNTEKPGDSNLPGYHDHAERPRGTNATVNLGKR